MLFLRHSHISHSLLHSTNISFLLPLTLSLFPLALFVQGSLSWWLRWWSLLLFTLGLGCVGCGHAFLSSYGGVGGARTLLWLSVIARKGL